MDLPQKHVAETENKALDCSNNYFRQEITLNNGRSRIEYPTNHQ